MDNQLDFFVTAQQQPLVDEIKRLSDLNNRLVDAAKELGAANDVAEWDDAWYKMCKLFKECKD
jgi:hypothetical protein